MTDISGVPAFGGGGFAYRVPPDQPKPAIPQVAKTASDGSATNTKGNELPGQNAVRKTDRSSQDIETGNARAQDRRDTRNEARDDWRTEAKHDKDVIAGPTPAFQASLLEVERDLRTVIARVEAKRTREADEGAIAPQSSEPREKREANETPREAREARETRPTERRDEARREEPEKAPEPVETSDVAAFTTSSEAVDPQTQVAGTAAVQKTPYDE